MCWLLLVWFVKKLSHIDCQAISSTVTVDLCQVQCHNCSCCSMSQTTGSVLTANQTLDRVSCHIVNNTHCQIRLFNVTCQALVKCQLLLSTPTSVMHVWESVSVSHVMMQISHGNVNWLSRHCQLSTTPSVLLSTKCQSCPMASQNVSKR